MCHGIGSPTRRYDLVEAAARRTVAIDSGAGHSGGGTDREPLGAPSGARCHIFLQHRPGPGCRRRRRQDLVLKLVCNPPPRCAHRGAGDRAQASAVGFLGLLHLNEFAEKPSGHPIARSKSRIGKRIKLLGVFDLRFK